MKKRKGTRTDSATAAVTAFMAAAVKGVQVPKQITLRTGDKPFWDDIVRARAIADWSHSDLIVAGQLARCMADIEREQLELDKEGTITVNGKGTQIMNPRVSVLEMLARREMALMRALAMTGVKKARDFEPGRQGAEEARAALNESDNLLA